ncbi:hypothetical protein DESC_270053 [Desulfosarcina cetonica]|nr:hypothetical protein DESC_270053 [Desulfosarcina cetonica]
MDERITATINKSSFLSLKFRDSPAAHNYPGFFWKIQKAVDKAEHGWDMHEQPGHSSKTGICKTDAYFSHYNLLAVVVVSPRWACLLGSLCMKPAWFQQHINGPSGKPPAVRFRLEGP